MEHVYGLLPAITDLFFPGWEAAEALKQVAMMGADSVGSARVCNLVAVGGADPRHIHLEEEDTVEDQGL